MCPEKVLDSINFLGEEIEPELIGTSTTSQGVIASAANQGVNTITTIDAVVASTTIEGIIRSVPDDCVIASSAN
ncbi:hypothetical protein NIES3804_42580 [Microcystis aeruginosa NIES-3804]|uniref:Uncharacterized protein n=1 Tax=Microcystis aeruginosa NIES-3804 TaxID=2517783 RepID=A0A6H9GPQ8_MICAE|nr:hypothetical protein NIES3804_42580 [Microcystis aeruginosa NIES-3804]